MARRRTVELLRVRGDDGDFRGERPQDYDLRYGAGQYERLTIPWSEPLITRMSAAYRCPARSDATQRLGQELAEIFAACWRHLGLADALRGDAPLELTICSNAPELYTIPFELMVDPTTGTRLGAAPGVALRYTWPGRPSQPVSAGAPERGRILFAYASPGLGEEEHSAALARATTPWSFTAAGDVLANASLADITGRLHAQASSAAPVRVLHLLCHGVQLDTTAGLALAGDAGVDVVDPVRLADQLRPFASSLRLVVLCACHSGDTPGSGNRLGSVAQALHRLGIPFVLAARFPLTTTGAARMTEALYSALAGGLAAVDSAVTAARRALQRDAERHEWAALQLYAASDAGVDAPPRERVDMTPPPTNNLVVRSDLLDLARERLQTPAAGDRGPTVALVGAGGFGKTTLARQLAADPQLRAAFPDGVLWADLGSGRDDPTEDPRLLDRPEIFAALVSLTTRLGAEPRPSFGDEAKQRLDAALAGRRLLVVVDDLSYALGADDPFVPPPGCARLVTTRSRDVARLVAPEGGAVLTVDRMTDDEALVALDRDAADLDAATRGALLALARQLGAWPLLLSLVQRFLDDARESGTPLAEAIAEADELLTEEGAAAFDDDDAPSREFSVARTLAVCMRPLAEDDRRRLRQLAALPAGAAVPTRVAAALWGVKQASATRLCRKLAARSLTLPYDGAARTIRLHDVIRRQLRQQLGDDTGLPALLRRIFSATAARGPSIWMSLAEQSPFFVENLPYMLEETCMWGAYAELLADVSYLEALARGFGAPQVEHALTAGATRPELSPGQRATLRALALAARRGAHDIARDPEALRFLVQPALFDGDDAPDEHPTLRREAPPLAVLRPPQRRSDHARVFFGHSGDINDCALLADGERLASASNDGTLRIWEIDTGRELGVLRGHGDAVRLGHRVNVVCALVGEFSHLVVSAGADRTLRVWDVDAQRQIARMRGHRGDIRGLCVLGDGRTVASFATDGDVLFWDAPSLPAAEDTTPESHDQSPAEGEEPDPSDTSTDGHTAAIRGCCVLKDGRHLATASDDWTVRIWETPAEPSRLLRGHRAAVTAIANLDDRRLVSASRDGTLIVWEIAWKIDGELEDVTVLRVLRDDSQPIDLCVPLGDGRRVAAVAGHRIVIWDCDSGQPTRLDCDDNSYVTALLPIDGGARLVTGESRPLASDLVLYDTRTGARLRRLFGHTGPVRALVATPTAQRPRRVLSASGDATLRLWDCDDEDTARPEDAEGHSASIRACLVAADRDHVLTAAEDQTLRTWDARRGALVHTAAADGSSACACLLGDELVVAGGDHLRVWSRRTHALLHTLQGHSGMITGCLPCADGRRVLTAESDGTIGVWDCVAGRRLMALRGHDGAVNDLCFVDAERVVSCANDHAPRLWELRSGAPLRALEGHTDWISACVSLGDGRVASASWDRTLRIWDCATGESTRALAGHAGCVRACASLGGGRLVSAADDHTLRIWDCNTGEALRVLEGHFAPVFACGLADDGEAIVSLSTDDTVRLWDARDGAPLGAAYGIPATCFASAGRQLYVGDALGNLWFLERREARDAASDPPGLWLRRALTRDAGG
ncbi:MAG: CHAT domain-containing protein [Myxococcales bacterium]|nr:CHAT domain-containing protein [Myxococcales bacterium]